MYLENFPGLQEPIDEEEIEAAVLSASSAGSLKRRASDKMRKIPIEEVDFNGDQERGKTRRSGRSLPNWASSASSSRTISVEIVETQSGNVAGEGQCWRFLPPPCRKDPRTLPPRASILSKPLGLCANGADGSPDIESPDDLTVKYPPMAFGGQIVYARTRSEVEKASSELITILQSRKEGREQIPLGFDIEWRPNFIKGERPKKSAVMQLCAGNSHCFVMHIFHSGIPPTLRALLADRSYVKVGISIAGDAAKISRDYSVDVSPLEDLSDFANHKLGDPRQQWGLSSLTKAIACKELLKPKKIRMGNWEVKVLSKEQLHYAATDAFASWFLYEALKSFPERISGGEDGP